MNLCHPSTIILTIVQYVVISIIGLFFLMLVKIFLYDLVWNDVKNVKYGKVIYFLVLGFIIFTILGFILKENGY